MAEFSSVAIPNTEIRKIRSKPTGQEYQIFVGFPYQYTPSEKALPVLYMLDANVGFSAIEFLRMLQHAQEVPEFLLVGIGYPVRHFLETLELRQRDYTPTAAPEMIAQTPSLQLKDEQIEIGRASNFLSFFREELFPFTEDTYRVVPGDRGIIGVSLGGLFALYTLFHHPDTFSRYVICSPSLWWGDGITFTYENEYASTHSHLKARVFMSAGSLEDEDIKGNMLQLSAKLRQRNYEGFNLKTHIFADETHVSGISAAICKGVKVVYSSSA
jgi:predicted alpha/beta superfamily hydrolase